VVSGNVETSQAITDTLYGAMGVMAASQGTMNNFTFGNDRYQYYETVSGGSGAGADPVRESAPTPPYAFTCFQFCSRKEGLPSGRGRISGGTDAGAQRRQVHLAVVSVRDVVVRHVLASGDQERVIAVGDVHGVGHDLGEAALSIESDKRALPVGARHIVAGLDEPFRQGSDALCGGNDNGGLTLLKRATHEPGEGSDKHLRRRKELNDMVAWIRRAK